MGYSVDPKASRSLLVWSVGAVANSLNVARGDIRSVDDVIVWSVAVCIGSVVHHVLWDRSRFLGLEVWDNWGKVLSVYRSSIGKQQSDFRTADKHHEVGNRKNAGLPRSHNQDAYAYMFPFCARKSLIALHEDARGSWPPAWSCR